MSFFKNLFSRKKEEAVSKEAKESTMVGLITTTQQRVAQETVDTARDIGTNLFMLEDQFVKKVMVNDEIPNEVKTLMILGSPLIRTSYIDRDFAEIKMIEIQRMNVRMTMCQTKLEFELGGLTTMEAFSVLPQTALQDAIEGRKAHILKVSEHAYKVQWPGAEKTRK